MSEETNNSGTDNHPEQPGQTLLADSAFEHGDDEVVEIGIKHPTTKERVGAIIMKHVGMPVIDVFRVKRHGDGRRDANPAEARRYLFKVAFLKFVPTNPNAALPLKPKQTELDYFLGKEKLVDHVIFEYLGQTYPNLDIKD
jgi:hypothetical protein